MVFEIFQCASKRCNDWPINTAMLEFKTLIRTNIQYQWIENWLLMLKRFDWGNYPLWHIHFSIIPKKEIWAERGLIMWFWTVWIVYIIYLQTNVMILCLLSNLLESSLAVHVGFLAGGCLFFFFFFVIPFQVVWQKMSEPLVHVASWDCGPKCLVQFDEPSYAGRE